MIGGLVSDRTVAMRVVKRDKDLENTRALDFLEVESTGGLEFLKTVFMDRVK